MQIWQTLLRTAAIAGALSSCGAAAFSLHEEFPIGHHNHHRRSALEERDASTRISKGVSSEGEDHSPIKAPSGSIFTSLPVGDEGDEIAAFWTAKADNASAKHAYIMIHGKLRNGGPYWTTMNDVLQSAIDDKVPGADKHAIVVAPQFFSKKYNSKQYTKRMLAWGDVNAWQAGEHAIHPSNSKQTSFDALDALVEEFLTTSRYPKMQNITIVGHGGGGQLNQRYAMIASPHANTGVHIRYIHGDSSSCAYFTKHRPLKIADADVPLPKKKDCKYYNTWRYGFDNFTGTAHGQKTPQEYFQQYISRDVVSIVGYQDIKAGGDTYCMAQLQGGIKRRDRNLSWWQYINTLARTNEDLDGFPATFGDLPDWSHLSNHQISVRLTVVEDAAHDAKEVFSGPVGRSTLFFKNVKRGWRPKGWKPAPPILASTSSSNSASSSSASTSSTSNGSSSQARPQSELTASSARLLSTSPITVTIGVATLILSTAALLSS